jgi:hypothetical protein
MLASIKQSPALGRRAYQSLGQLRPGGDAMKDARLLAKTEKGQNREHDYYQADYVDDVVHRWNSVWILRKTLLM